MLTKSCAEANFHTRFIFRSLADRDKRSAPDLMNKRQRKAHQNSKGTAGSRWGGGQRAICQECCLTGTVRTQGPTAQTRLDFHLPAKRPRQLRPAFSPASAQGKNRTRSPAVNKRREASPGLHFPLAVSPPCCSEWLLCIVESS